MSMIFPVVLEGNITKLTGKAIVLLYIMKMAQLPFSISLRKMALLCLILMLKPISPIRNQSIKLYVLLLLNTNPCFILKFITHINMYGVPFRYAPGRTLPDSLNGRSSVSLWTKSSRLLTQPLALIQLKNEDSSTFYFSSDSLSVALSFANFLPLVL